MLKYPSQERHGHIARFEEGLVKESVEFDAITAPRLRAFEVPLESPHQSIAGEVTQGIAALLGVPIELGLHAARDETRHRLKQRAGRFEGVG